MCASLVCTIGRIRGCKESVSPVSGRQFSVRSFASEEVSQSKVPRCLGNTISDLSPLEGLINLKGLWFQGNRITEVSPLMDLINLESLNLENNDIKDLSALASLTNLKWLSLVVILYLTSHR